MGIGGTAMGAVAGACADSGLDVVGSDENVYPPMSDFLAGKGIRYYNGFSAENLQAEKPDVVVVGNAMSRGNLELEHALNARMNIISLSELVRREFIKKHNSVVVTGTHGKTTTSSMCAWMLDSAELATGFLVGAITGNFGIGCRAVPAESGYFVSEGDEYDTAFFDKRSKFLWYRPDVAIINNIEFDHADIFSSLDDICKSFKHFIRLIPANGLLIANADDPVVMDVCSTVYSEIQTFGFSGKAYWRAVDVDYAESETRFTVLKEGKVLSRFVSSMAGEHNLRNMLATIAVAFRAGLNNDQIQHGLHTYQPPKRRMEVLCEWNGATVVDDFAHHPTAIAVTLDAIAQRYPQRRIIAVFEPRSNTTTRNFFQQQLSECFDAADVVVVGAVNRPERYAVHERLNVTQLEESLQQRGKRTFFIREYSSSWGEEVFAYLQSNVQANDVVVLLSNGDIGGLRKLLATSS